MGPPVEWGRFGHSTDVNFLVWQESEAVVLSRQSLPDKLPAAAALAFSAAGSRLLIATPEARVVVIDLDDKEVGIHQIEHFCKMSANSVDHSALFLQDTLAILEGGLTELHSDCSYLLLLAAVLVCECILSGIVKQAMPCTGDCNISGGRPAGRCSSVGLGGCRGLRAVSSRQASHSGDSAAGQPRQSMGSLSHP